MCSMQESPLLRAFLSVGKGLVGAVVARVAFCAWSPCALPQLTRGLTRTASDQYFNGAV